MAKMVLKSFEEINRGRKRTRKILLTLTILPFVLLCFLGWKVFSMYSNADKVIVLFEEQKFSEAYGFAEKQHTINFVEQWLANYNSGTVLSANGSYEESIKFLETALSMVRGDVSKECFVVNNLSLTYEKLGDELISVGDASSGEMFLLEGKKYIENAPLDCFPPSQGGLGEEGSETSSAGEQMNETKERIDGKLNEDEDEGEGSAPVDGEELTEEQKSEQNRDKIQKQMEDGTGSRLEDEQTEGGSSEEPFSKPW